MIEKYDILIVILVNKHKPNSYFQEKSFSISGRMIHSMVAHLDAVTSLAIDPQQTCLLSGSKQLKYSSVKSFILHFSKVMIVQYVCGISTQRVAFKN